MLGRIKVNRIVNIIISDLDYIVSGSVITTVIVSTIVIIVVNFIVIMLTEPSP